MIVFFVIVKTFNGPDVLPFFITSQYINPQPYSNSRIRVDFRGISGFAGLTCDCKSGAKNLNSISIRSVSRSQTVRFASLNGPFGSLKRTVLEREMACIANQLNIKQLQSRFIPLLITKYSYNYYHSTRAAKGIIARRHRYENVLRSDGMDDLRTTV